jgi:hypothetical protein
MVKPSSILGVVAGACLFGGTALAQADTSLQDELIPGNSTYMYNVPYGTSQGSDGQYVESGTYYNGAPVYTRTGSTGVTWSLYRRANGYWYVDFNTVSEDWDGTVAYTTAAQDWPWSKRAWNGNVFSFRTAKVEVYNVPYAGIGAAGTYAFSGTVYNNAPVYQRTGGGYTWSLYKRANGKWHVDFNTVSEDWDGTIAYTNAAQEWPWVANGWNSGAQVFRTRVVYLYNIPYANLGSTGEYTFSGTLYNNFPVYQRMVSGQMWSVYKRANGQWFVDFNTVSEDWDGTVAYTTQAMDYPWSVAAWNGTAFAFQSPRVSVRSAAYWSLGSAGDYTFSGQIYNNAPVYQRMVSGQMWSLYKRANGKWHLDFNTVSEDWDGTVAYTDSAMSYPWSSTAWHNGEVVSDIF